MLAVNQTRETVVVIGFCKNVAACDCSFVCHGWGRLEVI